MHRFKLTVYFSRQIRPPIYSLKQSKLRKRRVVRYAILYFVMLVVFIALVVGPVIIGKLGINLGSISSSLPKGLYQPTNWKNNDTMNATQTGTGAGARPAATTTRGRRMAYFEYDM